MYHYQVINSINNSIVLDSSLRSEFEGYSCKEKAYMIALDAKNDNRLSDLHIIKTFPSSRYHGFGGTQRDREKLGFGLTA